MASKPPNMICEGDVCHKVTQDQIAARYGRVPVFKLLSSSALQSKAGAQVPLSNSIGPNKVIALYFSAHWCPPCRQFTPKLAATYKSFKETHPRAADWEIIFVSWDTDQTSFAEYYQEMPWLALPFQMRDIADDLTKLYKVNGIPTLVLVDGGTGELITKQGREAILDDPTCAKFPWLPEPKESEACKGCSSFLHSFLESFLGSFLDSHSSSAHK